MGCIKRYIPFLYNVVININLIQQHEMIYSLRENVMSLAYYPIYLYVITT
jgi:hypothetical protein